MRRRSHLMSANTAAGLFLVGLAVCVFAFLLDMLGLRAASRVAAVLGAVIVAVSLIFASPYP